MANGNYIYIYNIILYNILTIDPIINLQSGVENRVVILDRWIVSIYLISNRAKNHTSKNNNNYISLWSFVVTCIVEFTAGTYII